MWSKTQEYSAPEQPLVSQQLNQPFIDQVVEPISYLVNPTLLSKSDPYVIEPMSSLVNPALPMESDFHEAIESIPLLINPTPPLESEVSTSHIFFTSSSNLTEKGTLNLFWINPHQDLGLLPLIGIA